MDNRTWLIVYRAAEYFKVEAAKNYLEENEIESFIVERPDSAYVMLSEVQLHVPESQAEWAKALLARKTF